MVHGGRSPGTQAALRRFFARPAVSAAGAAHTICGFCLLEAKLAAGNGARKAVCLLEKRIGWGFIYSGIAHRQAAPCDANLPRRDADLSVAWKTAGPVEKPEPGAASHLIHDS